MSVRNALIPAEDTALAGPSVPLWYAVYDDSNGDNVVATARVDAPIGLTFPLSVLPVKSTSAGWSGILANMAIFIGSTAGGFDKGIYRVRDDTSSVSGLSISAMGQADAGAINISNRTAGILNDDYVTILYRFDPLGVYSRIDYPGVGLDATIYENWADAGWAQFNHYPPPIVNLFIDGQPSNYATHLFSGSAKTFFIDFEIVPWPTSSTVSWTITLPSSWTLNTGSLTGTALTGTISVTAPHSASTYTLRMSVTENNGSASVAYRKVWIKSFTYPPLDIVKFDVDVDDRIGSKRTITFNKMLPDDPPGCMWHLFDAGFWNSTTVLTARKCFTGYVVKRNEITALGVTNVTLDLVGPSYMLDLIGSQSQIMTAVNASPANWQELYYTLSYLDFVIWWILAIRARGFLQNFNYTKFGLTNTQKRMTGWRIDAGTILQQVSDQARRYIGGNFGCDPTGEFMLRRHVSRIPWADRATVPVRDTLTASKYSNATLTFNPRPEVRRLRGECFYSDGLTVNTPVWSDAPQIPGQGRTETKFDKLITDSANELYEGNGNEYAARNNPYPAGSIRIPKNYSVFYPAQMSRVGLDIAPSLRYNNIEYTGYVLPVSASYTHNDDGTIDVDLAIEAETAGLPGVDVPIPNPDSPSSHNTSYQSRYQRTPIAIRPPWRSGGNMVTNPAGTTTGGAQTVPKDGSVAFCGTASKAYVVSNFLGTPIYKDVTPSDLGIYTIKHGQIQLIGSRAWILACNGVNSAVWRTSNVFAKTVTWTKGADVSGVYTIVRIDSDPNKILIYSPSGSGVSISDGITFDTGGSPYTILQVAITTGGNLGNCLTSDLLTNWDVTWDLTLSDYGFSGLGTWVAGVGWTSIAGNIDISSPSWAATYLGSFWMWFTIDYPSKADLYTLPDGTLQTGGVYLSGSRRDPGLNGVTGVRIVSTQSETITQLRMQGTTVNPFGGNPSVKRVFDSPVTVTGLSLDHKKNLTGDTTRTIKLYNASNVLLSTKTTTSNPGIAWATDTYGSLAIGNVKYIVYSIDPAGGGTDQNLWLDNANVTYSGGSSGNSTVCYSSDSGNTFGSALVVGTTPGSVGGFDIEHGGIASFASMALKTRKASTLGGAYADDQTFDTSPILIEIPWGKRNSSVLNTGANPEYIVGLSAPDASSHTLYWIVSGSPVNITPVIGGYSGIPTGPDSLCTWLGKYVAFLGLFNGVKKLVTSTNGGTTWTDRGADDALYLRLRRLSKSPGQLYPAGHTLKYTDTFGATLVSKAKPDSNDLVFFEPVG